MGNNISEYQSLDEVKLTAHSDLCFPSDTKYLVYQPRQQVVVEEDKLSLTFNTSHRQFDPWIKSGPGFIMNGVGFEYQYQVRHEKDHFYPEPPPSIADNCIVRSFRFQRRMLFRYLTEISGIIEGFEFKICSHLPYLAWVNSTFGLADSILKVSHRDYNLRLVFDHQGEVSQAWLDSPHFHCSPCEVKTSDFSCISCEKIDN